MKVFGVVGRDTTDLMDRLVTEISGRGFSVSTVMQADPAFDVDQSGKDSYRHRTAGASEVLLSSRKRFALMHELRAEKEPELEFLLSKLAPVDLVLVAGYETDGHSKIEACDGGSESASFARDHPNIKAIASDTPLELGKPVFGSGDTRGIADFILSDVGLA